MLTMDGEIATMDIFYVGERDFKEMVSDCGEGYGGPPDLERSKWASAPLII